MAGLLSSCSQLEETLGFAGASAQGTASVNPTHSFESAGPVGGPFAPATQTYTISNPSKLTLDWEAVSTASWVTAEPSSGTLRNGESTTITIGLDAGHLEAGSHFAVLSMVDARRGNTIASRRVILSVLEQIGEMDIAPEADLAFDGIVGLGFAPQQLTYTVSNVGGQDIDWSATSDQSWLQLSSSSGTLEPESSQAVVLSLDSVEVSDMAPGSYAATLTFSSGNGEGDTSRSVALVIAPPPGQLTLAPADDFLTTGDVGGPFEPAERTYTLSNDGGQSLDWTATASETWITVVDPAAGTLAPGETANVIVQVEETEAAGLAVGTHEATLSFADSSGGAHEVSAILTATDTAPQVTVLPASGYSPSGGEGGPFTPVNMAYTVTNTGTQPATWSAASTEAWVLVSPAGGTLAPSESVSVTVELDTAAAGDFTPGSFDSEVSFAVDGGATETRPVSLDIDQVVVAGGWTEFTASGDTQMIYVSSSEGNDDNPGTIDAPVATPLKGYQLMRDGKPDWLLFKRGDTWYDKLHGNWRKSGRSPQERMLVTSYGSGATPKFLTGGGPALTFLFNHAHPSNPEWVENLAFVDLEFYAHNRGNSANPDGLRVLSKLRHVLFEGLRIRGYQINLTFTGNRACEDIVIRRCVLVDGYAFGGGTQGHGLYMSNTNGVLVEENIIDHNGWLEDNPLNPSSYIYRHNVYIQNSCRNVAFNKNIVTNGCSHGLQLRPAGECNDNLFAKNAISVLLGSSWTSNATRRADFRRNVLLHPRDLPHGEGGRGWGLSLVGIDEGLIEGNVWAHAIPGDVGGDGRAMHLHGDGDPNHGIHNLLIENNVYYNWKGKVWFDGGRDEISGITLRDNDFQNWTWNKPLIHHQGSPSTWHAAALASSGNRFFRQQGGTGWFDLSGANGIDTSAWRNGLNDSTSVSQQVDYPDATRDLASYNASLGGEASYDAFMTQARAQSKSYWRPEYTALAANEYIRAGFGLVAEQ